MEVFNDDLLFGDMEELLEVRTEETIDFPAKAHAIDAKDEKEETSFATVSEMRSNPYLDESLFFSMESISSEKRRTQPASTGSSTAAVDAMFGKPKAVESVGKSLEATTDVSSSKDCFEISAKSHVSTEDEKEESEKKPTAATHALPKLKAGHRDVAKAKRKNASAALEAMFAGRKGTTVPKAKVSTQTTASSLKAASGALEAMLGKRKGGDVLRGAKKKPGPSVALETMFAKRKGAEATTVSKKKASKKAALEAMFAGRKGKSQPKKASVSSTLEEMLGKRKGAQKKMKKQGSALEAMFAKRKSAEETAERNIYFAKYTKMRKVGIATADVKDKMRKNGLSAEAIAEFFGESLAKATAVDLSTLDLSKYEKMKKFGLPPNAVRNKMKVDCVSPRVVAAFFGESLASVRLPPKPNMEKYAKMQKFGLPPAAVRNKMKQDAVAAYWVADFFGEPLPGAKIRAKRVATHNVKAFHWRVAEASDWSQTLWATVRVADCNAFFPKSFETKLLTAFKVPPKKKKRAAKCKQPAAVRLLDAKRAFNVEVGMKRVQLSDSQLRDALLSMDEANVAVDLLQKIAKYMPTNAELSTVRAFKGEKQKLGRAERLFLTLSCMSEIPMRLYLWEFKLTFRESERELEQRLRCVRRALDAAKGSRQLHAFLRQCLAAGNWLNDGRGKAQGFRLDSLQRFHSMRANDKHWTLLMLLVEHCQAEDGALFEAFPNALLSQMEAAMRLQPKAIRDAVHEMEHSLKAIGKKITVVSRKLAETKKGLYQRTGSVLRVFAKMKRGTSKWHRHNVAKSKLGTVAEKGSFRKVPETPPLLLRGSSDVITRLRRYRTKTSLMQLKAVTEASNLPVFGVKQRALSAPVEMKRMDTASAGDFEPSELDLDETKSTAKSPRAAGVLPPDRFEVVMTGFHRRSELRVEKMKAELEQLQIDAAKTAVYFCEEKDLEWDALFKLLYTGLTLIGNALKAVADLRKAEERQRKRADAKERRSKRRKKRGLPKASTEPLSVLEEIRMAKGTMKMSIVAKESNVPSKSQVGDAKAEMKKTPPVTHKLDDAKMLDELFC